MINRSAALNATGGGGTSARIVSVTRQPLSDRTLCSSAPRSVDGAAMSSSLGSVGTASLA